VEEKERKRQRGRDRRKRQRRETYEEIYRRYGRKETEGNRQRGTGEKRRGET
jgi:hypothetical protein